MAMLTDTFNTQTIEITPNILALFSKLDEFKGAWRALGSLAPERLPRCATYLLLKASALLRALKTASFLIARSRRCWRKLS